jgi:hypothetical protein
VFSAFGKSSATSSASSGFPGVPPDAMAIEPPEDATEEEKKKFHEDRDAAFRKAYEIGIQLRKEADETRNLGQRLTAAQELMLRTHEQSLRIFEMQKDCNGNRLFQKANSGLVFECFQLLDPSVSPILIIIASDASHQGHISKHPLYCE